MSSTEQEKSLAALAEEESVLRSAAATAPGKAAAREDGGGAGEGGAQTLAATGAATATEGAEGTTERAEEGTTAAAAKVVKGKKTPTVILVVGMAGSGKTSLMQRLNAQTRQDGKTPYVINLDPAVGNLGYEANIDIRETVKYKDVMKKYGLGPNGAIVTSLNLFATRFDQVLEYTEKRAAAGEIDYVLADTPGQIEVFTWSASGDIITQSLASSFPTVLVGALPSWTMTRAAALCCCLT